MKAERKLRDTAFHEAAHAVIAVVLGARIKEITITPRGSHVAPFGVDLTTDVIVSLAGGVAEGLLYPRRRNCHDFGDIENALKSAREYGYKGRAAERFVFQHEGLAVDLVARYWLAIRAVAKNLLTEIFLTPTKTWNGEADEMVRRAVRESGVNEPENLRAS